MHGKDRSVVSLGYSSQLAQITNYYILTYSWYIIDDQCKMAAAAGCQLPVWAAGSMSSADRAAFSTGTNFTHATLHQGSIKIKILTCIVTLYNTHLIYQKLCMHMYQLIICTLMFLCCIFLTFHWLFSWQQNWQHFGIYLALPFGIPQGVIEIWPTYNQPGKRNLYLLHS